MDTTWKMDEEAPQMITEHGFNTISGSICIYLKEIKC